MLKTTTDPTRTDFKVVVEVVAHVSDVRGQ